MADLKRILVPLDGSDLAEKALPLAVTLAQNFGSQLLLVYAVDFLHPTVLAPHLSMTVAAAMTTAHHQACQDAEHYLQAQQANLKQQGLQVEIQVRDTAPATAILEAATAHKIDLIVMSTHGRGGLARWTLGSVADKITHHAPCPVLLVRQELEAAG